jgi:two-component system cell cycle sensor histidine kinase/response regulator CckA
VHLNNRKTILLVDDDVRMIAFVSELLENSNYNVLTAQSGADAIKQSKDYQGEIALLLSDFQMPRMSGVELAVQITADRPQVKVLLMSGFPDGKLVLNEGWHFLAKPFIPSHLSALIMGLIYPDKSSALADATLDGSSRNEYVQR